MPERVWQPIPGFPYEASNDGMVRRSAGGSNATYPGRVRFIQTNNDGYRVVTLHFNGRQYHRHVSNLVLAAFTGEWRSWPEWHACHINGEKTDDRVDNLYWGSPIENAEDRRRHGRYYTGEDNQNSKLTEEQVRTIKGDYKKGIAGKKCLPNGWMRKKAQEYGVHRGTLHRAIRGLRYG